MVPPNKSDVKKRKTSPQPPSKKIKKNLCFTISSKYAGHPKYATITTPNSVIDFCCDIRRLTSKTSKVNNKSDMVVLDFPTHPEIKTHIGVIIESSLSELKTRNRVSTGNIVYPHCGNGMMVTYTVSHNSTYDANAPGIVDHMEFICMKIIDSIMSDIKLIDV